MDLKAKLAELLDEAEEWADHKCDVLDCEKCPADKMKGNCVQQLMVDRLIAHGVTVQEWISVKDRLPEDSTYVLVRLSGGAIYQALCLTKGSKQWYGANLERFVNKDTVTHWMPLPQPPKGE